MSEYVLNNDILASIRAHSGISNMPNEAVEIVWKDAEKAARERGISIEFIAADLVKALWAQAFQEARRNGKPQQDFDRYCKEQLAGKESIFSNLFAKKSKVASLVAEAEQIEAEITETRNALGAAQSKAQELKGQIESTEAELSNHTEEAVQESINEAAKLWHLKGRSPHNASIISASVSHALEADAVNRILNARIIYLRDLLAKEEAKVEAFKQELKALEKQL
jgi:chromosome segregation ATPase